MTTALQCYALPIATHSAELGATLFGSLSPLARHASALALALRTVGAQRVDKVDAVIRGALPANRTYCLAYPTALNKLLEAERTSAALRQVLATCDRNALTQLPAATRPTDGALPLAALLARVIVVVASLCRLGR